MSYIIDTKDIVKNFSKHRALHKLTIQVPETSIFGILGPNGAGKTTLLRIINRIIAPDSGQVFFQGQPISRKHVESIGYLPEERGLYKKMRVGEQALYLARLRGMSADDARKELNVWFEKFEMTKWWNKKVEELSKGMQQKVQFVVTVAHRPRLLIVDEPFSGFDPINAQLLKNEILNLRKEGVTVILSTHNMASVEELCDHIALINQSEKILGGKLEDIRHEYKTNRYEVVFGQNFNRFELAMDSRYNLLDIQKLNDGNTRVILHLPQELPENQLLERIMKAGHVLAFRELLPGMNDIFIQAIKRVSQTENQSPQ